MIVDYTTGRIAYHAYVFTEEGGTDFIQYDFDGKELYRSVCRRPLELIDVGSA